MLVPHWVSSVIVWWVPDCNHVLSDDDGLVRTLNAVQQPLLDGSSIQHCLSRGESLADHHNYDRQVSDGVDNGGVPSQYQL